MIVEISVAVFVIMFIVLSYFIIQTLQHVRSSLRQANQTMVRMEKNMQELSEESVKAVQSAKLLADDAQQKLQAMNGVIQSTVQIGEAIQQVSNSTKQAAAVVSYSVKGMEETMQKHRETVTEMIEWFTLGMTLVRKWKNGKKAN